MFFNDARFASLCRMNAGAFADQRAAMKFIDEIELAGIASLRCGDKIDSFAFADGILGSTDKVSLVQSPIFARHAKSA